MWRDCIFSYWSPSKEIAEALLLFNGVREAAYILCGEEATHNPDHPYHEDYNEAYKALQILQNRTPYEIQHHACLLMYLRQNFGHILLI